MNNDRNLDDKHDKTMAKITATLKPHPEILSSSRRKKTPWWNRNWKLYHGFGDTYDKRLCIGGQQVLIEESSLSTTSKVSQSMSDDTDRAYMSACW
jgi:hypothetical protein